VRAALRVSSFSSAKDAVTNFRKTLNGKRYRNEEAERYGYALALTANKQYGKAKEQLDILQRNRPEQLAYMIAEAKVLNESGQPDKGLQVLRDGLDLYPGNYALTIHYANALLDQGKAAEALKELKEKHGPYEYVYKEYNGIGHGYPPGGFGPIIDWMISHKRKPYPDYIVWEPSRPYKKLFWWIKVRSGGGQIVAKYNKSKNLIEIDVLPFNLIDFVDLEQRAFLRLELLPLYLYKCVHHLPRVELSVKRMRKYTKIGFLVK